MRGRGVAPQMDRTHHFTFDAGRLRAACVRYRLQRRKSPERVKRARRWLINKDGATRFWNSR
jgi:hypothetical protein